MSVIARDVGQYIARKQFTFDLDKRDQIIAFAEQLDLPESMGSRGKNWHLSDATLEKFVNSVQQSRPDLLVKNATNASPTHFEASGEVQLLSGDHFDRLPPAERLRLSNSHNILRADDGTVTLQRR